VSERVERIGNSVIVYDDALVGQIGDSVFNSRGDTPAARDLAGRGSIHYKSVDGRPCVLRHYYRGGMIRSVSEDSFVWAGEDRTRSFREWRLLAELRRRDLPVPRPVAARYVRRGIAYTADLVTERLTDVESLAARLDAGSVSDDTWRNIGAVICRFHGEKVFHADLNAHNIQIDGADRVYLLDFDRGRVMPDRGPWTERNLQRLRRSLDKIRQQDGARFEDGNWTALMAGYGDRAGP